MKHNLLKKLSILTILVPNFAFALGTATTTFTVGTTAQPVCTISSTSMNFGPYDGLDPVTADSTFTVSCDADATATWQMDGGTHFSETNRRMGNGTSSYLNYALYQNTARDIPINVNTSNNTYNEVAFAPPPEGQVYHIYGTIPAGQLPDTTTTAYSDTITITIGF